MLSRFSHVRILCRLPLFLAHGILQARILEWVAMPSSRGSSQPRDQALSYVSCVGKWVLYASATWEALYIQSVHVSVCVKPLQSNSSVTLRTVALQAPLSMGFSRQEYWSGLPCAPPGALPDPGIKSFFASCIGRQVLYH